MRAIGRDPLFMQRGAGGEIFDVDENPYVDWVCSWGPLIAGHAHPAIVAAVTDAAQRGTSFGAPTAGEVDLAEEVSRRVPGVEMLRMTSSGTEASMSAIRLARAATGRTKLLKFAGAYHGHVDGLLADAGSGLATQGIPASPGVPAEVAAEHDRRALERSRRARRGDDGARARRDPRRALPGEHGPRPAGRGLPRAAARARRRHRRAADLRRGHLRLSRLPRRRPGARRRHPGHHGHGQGHRRRPAGRRVRRLALADGAHRAGRRRLPGGHAVGQPARRRRRPRDARAARRRAAVPRARGDDARARRRASPRPPARRATTTSRSSARPG